MCTFLEFFFSFTISCRRGTSKSSFHFFPSLKRKEIQFFENLSTFINTSKPNTYSCICAACECSVESNGPVSKIVLTMAAEYSKNALNLSIVPI